ncbi:MAG: hypothetical protein GF346_06385 [Candidatus Eisenbacteria bacterium]|nr:hypothetical protein [Candidatus Latescibacterota bacterium]MBD3302054.1 hypothetical protein [Candidatus Eisenbacteria bacterium]
MPHVELEGPCDLRSYWEGFESRIDRSEERILKTLTAYLEHRGRSLVIEATVVEGYLQQTVLVEIVEKDRKALVRLFHGQRPQKTAGLRSCIGWIAADLIRRSPGCRWRSDTLGLPASFPPLRSP